MKAFSFFLIFSLCSLKSIAQIDSTYIGKSEKMYGVKLYFTKESLSLNYTTEELEERILEPNKPASIGVGILWKNSELSYSQSFSFLGDRSRRKSKTFDFKYNYYGERFLIDLYLQRYKSFYLLNEGDKTYEAFPDLQLAMYGVSAQYVFNHKKYSFAATNSFNKIQLKSAGSFLLGANIFYSKTRNTPAFDLEIQDYDKRLISFGPTVGYGYNFVFLKHYFTGISVLIGVNGNFEKNLLTNQSKFIITPQIQSKFSLGYSDDNWTIALAAPINALFINYSDAQQSNLLSSKIMITATKRFDLKKEIPILKKDLTDYLKEITKKPIGK